MSVIPIGRPKPVADPLDRIVLVRHYLRALDEIERLRVMLAELHDIAYGTPTRGDQS